MIRRAGYSLIELLVAMAIVGILIAAMGRTYVLTMQQDAQVQSGREQIQAQRAFENRVAELFRHAYLSADTTSQTTYFVATDNGNGPDTVTFTMLGDLPNQAYMDSDQDFESLNSDYGPQGGVAEISISISPVGNSPFTDALYLREQRPADGDPLQGGYESVLHSDVTSVQFEFYDGSTWITSWDTREQTTARLPAAVRITYRLSSESSDRTMTVRLPASDVTAENPLEATTTTP